MTSRRTPLVVALALVLVGLTVSPARAAQVRRVSGHLTPVLRSTQPVGRASALRRESLVAGAPATQHQSQWS